MIDKLKSILKAIGRELGIFMTPSEKRRKEKFFGGMRNWGKPISARTSERTDKDGNKILMVEEIDDVDYRAADHLDEIAEIERRNNKG